MPVTKQLMVPTDFISIFVLYYGSQWGPSTLWLPISLQNIFFCVQNKKETHTGLEQLEAK